MLRKDLAMDDMTLTAQEQQQLRQDLANVPPDLKQGFCSCWPAVKQLLEWIIGQKSGPFTWVLKFLVWVGDGIFKALDCEQNAGSA
jgi:hypothetical protein